MGVKIIYGPPCSGKSTYVSENLADDDIRFDYDSIMQSISNKKSHEYSDLHLPYVIKYRGLIIEQANKDEGMNNVYIIATRLTDKLNEELTGMDVEYKLIETTKEECYEFLETDSSRVDKEFWKQKIDDWFAWHDEYLGEGGELVKKAKKPENSSKLMTVKNLTAKSADLYIYGEIVDNSDFKWDEAEVMPSDVLATLNAVEGSEELNIYINSPGGGIFAGQAIYNILKRNKAKKIVHVDGVAASMASVIAMAGDVINIPSNAFLMVHNPWAVAMGNANDFRKMAEDLDVISVSLLAVYMENTKEGVTEETIKDLLDAETWMNGEEAAKYFNVEVIEAKNVAACDSAYLQKYSKTPDKLKEKPVPATVTVDEQEKIKLQNELDLLNL